MAKTITLRLTEAEHAALLMETPVLIRRCVGKRGNPKRYGAEQMFKPESYWVKCEAAARKLKAALEASNEPVSGSVPKGEA
jgi:hypothetical protein